MPKIIYPSPQLAAVLIARRDAVRALVAVGYTWTAAVDTVNRATERQGG